MGNICSRAFPAEAIHKEHNQLILTNKQLIRSDESNFKYNAGIFVQENMESFDSLYELAAEPIGIGSFAEVWKCTHKRTGDIRAVKVFLKSTLSRNEIKTRSVFNEAEILKSLDHPNILKVYEFFEDQLKYYIVTEYYDGGDLFSWIKEKGNLNERVAAKVMRLLLSGINYMHSKQIIHRDIKPDNILLIKKEKFEDFSIKIIDFNIAKAKNTKNSIESTGTIEYMAPEVIKGIYNEKCDIWSCGIVLYIMVSGIFPFSGKSDRLVEEAICKGEYNFHQEYFGKVSKECKDFISKLLIKDSISRLSAQEALNHPWLKKGKEKCDRLALTGTLRRMKTMIFTGKLRELFKTFMISQLSSSLSLKKLEEAFHAIDINGDGVISKEELIEQLSLDMSINDAELKALKIMALADNDGSGGIDYTEFLKVTIDDETLYTKENLRKAFSYLDKDGSNAIELNELEEWLNSGNILPESAITKLMEEADTNRDGKIDLEEFENLLMSALKMDEPLSA